MTTANREGAVDSRDLELTVSGHDLGLYFRYFLEQRAGADTLARVERDEDVPFDERYAPCSFLWRGLREDPLIQTLSGAAGVDVTADDALLRFVLTPDRGIPYKVIDRVIVPNVARETGDPDIFHRLALTAYRNFPKVAPLVKALRTLGGTPAAILHSTSTWSTKLNNVLDMLEIQFHGRGSLQHGTYRVENSIFDERFTQGVAQGSPRTLRFYNNERWHLQHVATHSQARLDGIVEILNDLFDAGFQMLTDGVEVSLDGGRTVYGRYVLLSSPQDLIPEQDVKGKNVAELERMLIPQEGVHYTRSLSPQMIGEPQVAFLCEKDVSVRGKRMLRAGQFYGAPHCLDQFFYEPRGGWYGIVTKITNAFTVEAVRRALESVEKDRVALTHEQAASAARLVDEMGRRYEAEKGRYEAELEAAKERAARQEVAGQFAETVAHHGNNAVTGIRGLSSALRTRAGQDPEVSQLLDALNWQVDRFHGIVRELRGVRRVLSEHTDEPLQEFSLNALIDKELRDTTVPGLQSRQGYIPTQFSFSLPSGDYVVSARYDDVTHALQNLVTNAYEAITARVDRAKDDFVRNIKVIEYRHTKYQMTPEQVQAAEVRFFQSDDYPILFDRDGNAGTVTISLADSLDSYVVSVQDTGVGIAEDRFTTIFKAGVTDKRTKLNAESGSGLGLTIAKAVAERYHGRIELESTLGVGSTFRFYLPKKTIRSE